MLGLHSRELRRQPRDLALSHEDRLLNVARASFRYVLVRSIGVAAGLVMVPFLLGHLGVERFGLWRTLIAISGLCAFADLGIGNGLLNAVSKAHSYRDDAGIRRLVAAGIGILGLVAMAFFFVGLWVVPGVDWARQFNLFEVASQKEIGPALMVFVVCFSANIPLSVVSRIQLGLQKGHIDASWQGIGALLGVGGMLIVIRCGGGLPWVVAAQMGGPILANISNTILFFGFTYPHWCPRTMMGTADSAKHLFGMGVLFFILQVAGALAFASDNVLIAHLLGANQVTHFALVAHLFATITLFFGTALQSLWPAYADAVASKDFAWARRTLWRSVVLFSTSSALVVTLVLVFFSWILRLWIGYVPTVSWSLKLGFAAWIVVEVVGNSMAMFFNGAHIVRFQVVTATLFACGCLATKVFFLPLVGTYVLPWLTVGTYVLVILLPGALYVNKYFSKHTDG